VIPTIYWILLVVVCGLLWLIIPWWQALAIYCVCHVVFLLLGYRAYKKAVETVREITGADVERSYRIYVAFRTGDWSKIATDELRVVAVSHDEKVKRYLEKGAPATFKRNVITAIIIERSNRAAIAEAEKFFENE
jgi:hypothetical protein